MRDGEERIPGAGLWERGRLRGGVNYGAELGRGTYPGGETRGRG